MSTCSYTAHLCVASMSACHGRPHVLVEAPRVSAAERAHSSVHGVAPLPARQSSQRDRAGSAGNIHRIAAQKGAFSTECRGPHLFKGVGSGRGRRSPRRVGKAGMGSRTEDWTARW
ncbi:hypothetical protein B0H17DRAFT_1148346 [Mycena rosella]|uniref:Uncharacterized protein n=1 Tax=Mycena rosella TaxID=1033263 RepID=A0AAD7CD00_MYCRO|nr:hypothetical protein B0H17DRAFT_1148346 [Mycena rosella]